MTWYFDAAERWMDVYDHNGDRVAEGVEFGGRWEGDFPDEVFAVMRDALGDGQPSAYNQLLLADAATENIKEGTPPDYTGQVRGERIRAQERNTNDEATDEQ